MPERPHPCPLVLVPAGACLCPLAPVPEVSGVGRLADADRRALSPLFWSHANLYDTIQIDMDTRLGLAI